MKKISHWAKGHKWSARFVLVILHLMLASLAIVSGILLSSLSISITSITLLLFVASYGFALILYPSKNKERKKATTNRFYVRQKSCDFMLAASTFFMFVYMANHPDHLFQYGSSLNATVVNNSSLPGDSAVKSYKSISAFTASMRDENGKPLRLKERKKLLKEQVKAIRRSDELSGGAKVALIILSAIVALLLLYGVAALACSLSCNGSEVAAFIVGVGGGALVIWLLFVVIRSILGDKRKKRKKPGKDPVINPEN